MMLRIKIHMQFRKVFNDSHPLVFAYGYFFPAPALKKSRVVQSDDEIEQVRPISTLFSFNSQFDSNVSQQSLQRLPKPLPAQRDYQHVKTPNLRSPLFYSRTKPRMLMRFSIHRRRLVESHGEHVFFASTSGISDYWPVNSYSISLPILEQKVPCKQLWLSRQLSVAISRLIIL